MRRDFFAAQAETLERFQGRAVVRPGALDVAQVHFDHGEVLVGQRQALFGRSRFTERFDGVAQRLTSGADLSARVQDQAEVRRAMRDVQGITRHAEQHESAPSHALGFLVASHPEQRHALDLEGLGQQTRRGASQDLGLHVADADQRGVVARLVNGAPAIENANE